MSIAEDIKNVFRRKNSILTQLIVVNVLVFLAYTIFTSKFFDGSEKLKLSVAENLALQAPFEIYLKKFWGIITFSFFHQNFVHLLGNMLLLFFFGGLIQEYLGSRKLLNIYIFGGIFGGLFYILTYNLLLKFGFSTIEPSILGASAAGYAVAFAAITLLPEYEFYIFGLFLLKIKYLAWFFLLFPLVFELQKGFPQGSISHIGGAVLGYSYIILLRKGTDLGSPLEGLVDWWRNLWTPKPKMKVTHRRYSESTVSNKANGGSSLDPDYFPDQDEVDSILDKIGNSGYESLTREEKQKLYRASQKKD